jgi:hypothetical protein
MPASKFTLRASGVEVGYTVGITAGLPALHYREGAFQKSFAEAEITTEDTGLGRLVSFALVLSVDTGGTRFGFFLPFIDVARGHTATFHTVGINEMFSGPNSVPHRPSRWRCFEMTATAEAVTVPL